MASTALVFIILISLQATAFGVVGVPQALDPVSRLEGRLRSAYEALPRNGEGLPDASGVRYLARRYLQAEHGWVVKGLDMEPWLRDGGNASQAAALRASEVWGPLRGGGGLATLGSLVAALSPEPGRGFTLREAAEAVNAVEELMARHDAALMRRARALSKVSVGRGGEPEDPMQKALAFYAVLTHATSRGADVVAKGLGKDQVAARALEELADLRAEFSQDMSGEPLELVVAEATQKATAGEPRSGARMYNGMHHLRHRLRERHALGCKRLRGVLSSMDHEGSGQVEFRQAYATKLKDWALLETPEYLGAVGALADKGAKGGGPGVLIPNYVSGINSCRDPGAHPTMMCCPDECEAEIWPRLEAASAGPRIAPKQVWAALSRLIKGDKMVTADKRRELHSQLRALGLRSSDGLLEVHGRRLGRWLHHAFPHKCRGPAAPGSPAVVDPAVAPTAWAKAGKYLPLDAPEVEEIRVHLQARWGPDGTGADPRSFAARSSMSLDQELQLIHRLHEQQKSGGPPVQQALEDALNVRMLDRSAPAEYLLATAFAAALLGPLAVAVALAGRLAAEVCSSMAAAAAAAGRARAALAPPAREGGGSRAEVAPSREGSRCDFEAGPAGSEKDESTDAGDTDSEVAGELGAEEDSEAEREAAAEAARGCADADDEHPSQREAALDAAAKTEEEAYPQKAPAAAEVLPLAEVAGAARPPSPAALPRGFGPPPGLEPPLGLQLKLEALGLEPDWHHRSGKEQDRPTLEHALPDYKVAGELAWRASPDGARLMSLVCRQLK